MKSESWENIAIEKHRREFLIGQREYTRLHIFQHRNVRSTNEIHQSLHSHVYEQKMSIAEVAICFQICVNCESESPVLHA